MRSLLLAAIFVTCSPPEEPVCLLSQWEHAEAVQCCCRTTLGICCAERASCRESPTIEDGCLCDVR